MPTPSSGGAQDGIVPQVHLARGLPPSMRSTAWIRWAICARCVWRSARELLPREFKRQAETERFCRVALRRRLEGKG